MKRLEALVDALAEYAGSANPSSELYKLRNPIGLRVFTCKHGKPGEFRKFSTWINGYHAALYDLEVKCSGRSRAAGLAKKDANLRDLAKAFCLAPGTERNLAKFLQVALEDDTITADTRIESFLELFAEKPCQMTH